MLVFVWGLQTGLRLVFFPSISISIQYANEPRCVCVCVEWRVCKWATLSWLLADGDVSTDRNELVRTVVDPSTGSDYFAKKKNGIQYLMPISRLSNTLTGKLVIKRVAAASKKKRKEFINAAGRARSLVSRVIALVITFRRRGAVWFMGSDGSDALIGFFFRCSSSLEHVFVQVAHCLAKKKTKRNEKQTVNIRLKERENKTEMGPYIIDDQREMMEEASYRHRTRTWNAGAEKQLRTEFSLLFLPSLASMMHELGDIAFSAPIEMSIDRERENAIWVATKTISPTKRRINQRKKIRNMRWRW